MLRISVAGDLMCKGQEAQLLLARFGDYRFHDYVGGLKDLFSKSDYVIGNLETPVGANAKAMDTIVSFNTPKKFLEDLSNVGFDFLSLANNHCLDCGVEGLCATIHAVRAGGFDCDGAYLSRQESKNVCIVELRGLRVAIICSTYGTNSEVNGVMLSEEEKWRVALLRTQLKYKPVAIPKESDAGAVQRTYIADAVSSAAIGNTRNEACLEEIVDKIRRAREVADIVIAMPHVGGQYNPGPATYAKYIVRKMKEAGADIVIAGHPHVVHRCEQWKADDAFCCYSLGNACFTPGVGYYVPNTLADYGIILHLEIDETKKSLAAVRFDVVKSVVDEGGLAHARPIVDIWSELKNAPARDRFLMEVEAVVNRFRGGIDDVEIQREYEFPRCLSQL